MGSGQPVRCANNTASMRRLSLPKDKVSANRQTELESELQRKERRLRKQFCPRRIHFFILVFVVLASF